MLQKTVFKCLLFLGWQGISLCGQADDRSNFCELLKFLEKYNSDLAKWLNRQDYKLSHQIRNKILEILAHDVL